jgi:hypothetical protein
MKLEPHGVGRERSARLISAPLSASQICVVLKDPVTTCLPSPLNVALSTGLGASKTATSLPPSTSQIRAVPS